MCLLRGSCLGVLSLKNAWVGQKFGKDHVANLGKNKDRLT